MAHFIFLLRWWLLAHRRCLTIFGGRINYIYTFLTEECLPDGCESRIRDQMGLTMTSIRRRTWHQRGQPAIESAVISSAVCNSGNLQNDACFFNSGAYRE